MIDRRRARAVALAVLSGTACYVGLPDASDESSSGGGGVTGVLDTDPSGDPSSAGSQDESGGPGDASGDESGDTGVPGEDGLCGDAVVQDDEACDHGSAN